jgi:hypothetical protein
MKAYLELVIIARRTNGDGSGEVSTSSSTSIIDFNSRDEFDVFEEKLSKYEKGHNFELYRTLVPIVPLY